MPHAIMIDIPEEDVIAEGLIKKLLIINENFEQHINVDDQITYLLDKAIDKQLELHSEYIKQKAEINPLIIVQIPNKSDALLNRVEEYFESKGITYENNLLAVWLSDKKQKFPLRQSLNSSRKIYCWHICPVLPSHGREVVRLDINVFIVCLCDNTHNLGIVIVPPNLVLYVEGKQTN